MLTGSLMAGCGFQEYPKWVGDVVAQNEAEERAHLAAVAALTGSAEATQIVPSRSHAAIRMRRSRERRRDGKRTILYDISADQIEALALAGFIDPAIRDYTAEVAQGIGRLIDRALPILTPGTLEAAVTSGPGEMVDHARDAIS
jgi:hypothetical protein